MNRFFIRLPLPAKLMLIAVIPLGLLVYFSIQIFREKNEKLDILQTYYKRSVQAGNIASVVEALQTERRYSFGYAIKKDWQSELLVQRPKSDEALNELRSGSVESEKIIGYTMLDSLPSVRQKIDRGMLAAPDVLNFYTNSIFRLNTLNNVSVGNILYLQPVAKDLAAQKIFSEMVTYLGIIRANIYYVLYTRNMNQQLYESTTSVMQIYRSYEKELRVKASDTALQAYDQLLGSGSLATTMKIIDSFIVDGETKIEAEYFWDVSAKGIDDMMLLQRELLHKVQAGVLDIVEKEKNSRNITLAILLLTIGIVIFLVVYTIMIITRSLYELNSAAEKIARGETGLKIIPSSEDVIGNLAHSFILIDQNNKALASAAHAIGAGDFDVAIEARSENDMLGNAVVKMKDDLQLYNKENEEKLWVHSGIEKVSGALRGEKSVNLLMSDTLQVVAEHIGAGTGLAYSKLNGSFLFESGYAVVNENAVPKEIPEGSSLLGLAGKKQEIIFLDDIPEDYIKIGTAIGATTPRYIVMVPLVQNGSVEGVLELASIHPFPPAAVSFLRQVHSSIALAIQISWNRRRLQELLEETQSQAEELQAQHSEMENINAELEAQTEKLQASEEELKVQQEELMQANQELEERSRLLEERNQVISERNIEIQKTAEELELSTKYKSEFLANMSHELRTPLNSILLLSRLLSENQQNNLNTDQVEYAQVIQSSGRGLLTLIDDILDLSKIEAGKMEVEFLDVSINEIVQDMQTLFAPLANDKNIALEFLIDNDLPSKIQTDKLRLEQVLKNLLSNAIKFTNEGSVQLQVKAMPGNKNFIAFTVKDTGIGIPADKHHLVFEAFQQADGSTRRRFGGTGLGLSISRELTRLLGGEIKVTSEPGKGSEFTIYIPVKVQEPVRSFGGPVSSEPDFSQAEAARMHFRSENIPASVPDDRDKLQPDDKIILIIEDDTAFAKALMDYTHGKGYKALIAVRGDEGIELALKYLPMGILLDIQLPVKDGWEVMEELKSNPSTRPIPVHIMSSQQVKKESIFKGAIDFISKPVAFEQMQEVFRKIENTINKEKKKVLIIEENSKHAQALAYFLETFDVNAQISDSIHNGIDTLQQKDVDCVILDMGIPDEQAYALLEQMKKSSQLDNIPVIVFTGKNFSKTEESRIRQYADTIVIKTANSYKRILDEVSLFLHLVEENAPGKKSISKFKRLGGLNEVLNGRKVLVADDDVRNIFSLSRALEAHNMEIFSAVDGKEAISMLEKNPEIDLVLMDIMMPEMDGYEAIRAIRKKPDLRNLPIIAVTAKAMTGDREKCIKAGASDYISKPVDIDQLLSLLRVWLYDKNN
jgi:signal transduction histidine kinase/DNA-binding response OmpR family regulator